VHDIHHKLTYIVILPQNDKYYKGKCALQLFISMCIIISCAYINKANFQTINLNHFLQENACAFTVCCFKHRIPKASKTPQYHYYTLCTFLHWYEQFWM